MKVILHGSTNGRNFGDFLFASMFYEKLKEKGHDVYFYEFPKFGINEFYRKHLGYNKKCNLKTLLNADALVYFSGGYFGERTKTKKETIIRYLTYFPVGELFKRHKKNILIVGVGGAPISSNWLRKRIVKIINYASLVIFRDGTTTDYYKKNGVTNTIETTVDSAIALVKYRKPDKKRVKKYLLGKKNVFIHVSGNAKTDEKILSVITPAVNNFVKNNPEWNVIIGGDNANNKEVNNDIKSLIKNGSSVIAEYNDPWLLYNLLGSVDLIITPKLHVGIIGSSFGKSVVSFPYHAVKTKRFYEQIDESARCIPISEIDQKTVLSQIEKYCSSPIKMDKSLFGLSEYNLNRMVDVLADIEKYEK